MRLFFNKKESKKAIGRAKKKVRIRRTINGSAERPRLTVFRSNRGIYVQLVDDTTQTTLAAVSTLKWKDKNNKTTAAKAGRTIAELAKSKNIKKVVFDRSGFLYHGRVKAVADAAREAGLEF